MGWAEIKKAVNSNLGKPLDVLIEEKANEVKTATASQTSVNTVTSAIGTTNDTGGTATGGGIFAKLNKLLTDWTTARAGKIDTIATDVGTVKTSVAALASGGMVKSVQMGFVEFSSKSSGVYNVSHGAVTLNKSLLIVSMTETGAEFMFPTLRTETYFSVPRSGSSNTTRYYELYWQLVEFY